ncbi:hypothetical protein LTR66_003887 [Elasticomyces elasticus]|nr:hypothetical protein LTR50_007535 [Elasticomyces elasticus]KAK4996524.1 hypothetical protein LTR66_003887 [Elasticomyces elasticus]
MVVDSRRSEDLNSKEFKKVKHHKDAVMNLDEMRGASTITERIELYALMSKKEKKKTISQAADVTQKHNFTDRHPQCLVLVQSTVKLLPSLSI